MGVDLSPRATEIVEQTRALLANGGYHGFSYADVSERVHIGKPSIHHHFPSKAELVFTVVAWHREQTQAGLAALDQHIEDPLARLTAYTDYWAKCIREGTSTMCICAMLAAESPMIPEAVATEVRHYFADLTGWLTSVLAQGAERGQFRLRDAAQVEAKTFMSVVHGAMLTARAFNDPEAFASVTRATIKQLTASS